METPDEKAAVTRDYGATATGAAAPAAATPDAGEKAPLLAAAAPAVEANESYLDFIDDLPAEFNEFKALVHAGPNSWTAEEEATVRRKTDMRVTMWACVMFFSFQLTRIAIQSVLTTNFVYDNSLGPNDFGLGQTVFIVCFFVFEIPTQIMTTIVGSNVWLPITMSCWGTVAFMQAFITNRASFFATRALLGVCEGGFVPGIVLFVSAFYKQHELSTRMAILWTTNYLTNVVSALLASAILKMDTVGGLHGWQWLFFFEGALAFSIGISSFFLMPSFKHPPISRIFTSRETAILRARVIFDDNSKARALDQSSNKLLARLKRRGQAEPEPEPVARKTKERRLTARDFVETIFDKYLFFIFVLGFLGFVPSVSSYQFITILMRNMDFSTTESNFLVIPANLLLIVGMLTLSHYADKWRQRWWAAVVSMFFLFPFLIALTVLSDTANRWIRVVCITLTVGFPYFTPILVSWVSANANDQTRRALALAIYNIFVQFGNILAVNLYRADDGPFYHRGNKILLGIAAVNVSIALFLRWFFPHVNARRERIWSAMSDEQRQHYLRTTKDTGNRRLDFRLNL
ncbi:major facilitator superfamily domain-containing protein [Dipodascopsis tothii]|uniref:major facilitator superfamily domain-containing protein n=1 Tax=Dipodascopsis tothii TaxID=44089 RepID=UPI0034CF59E1